MNDLGVIGVVGNNSFHQTKALIQALAEGNDVAIAIQDNKDLPKLDRIEECYENNLS